MKEDTKLTSQDTAIDVIPVNSTCGISRVSIANLLLEYGMIASVPAHLYTERRMDLLFSPTMSQI